MNRLILYICLAILAPCTLHAQTSPLKTRLFSQVFNLAPAGKNSKPFDSSFMMSVIEAVKAGKINAFADSGFTRRLSVKEFNDMATATSLSDTSDTYDDSDREVRIIVNFYFDLNTVSSFKALLKSSAATKELIGLAPVHLRRIQPGYHYLLSSTMPLDLFWLRYSDVQAFAQAWDKKHPGSNFASFVKNVKVPANDVIDYPNGDKYVGLTQNGKPQGKGVMYLHNDNWITGTWKNGTITEGTYHYFLGSYYTGQIVNNAPEGKGTKYLETGTKISGTWKDGKVQGHGTYTWSNGDKYTGSFGNDNFNGKGTITWVSGNKYTGDFVNDLREGKGTMTWANGNRYEGDWKNDDQSGEGTYYWNTGEKYVGHLDSGVFSGHGIKYEVNGDHYDGDWKNDEQWGQGTYFWADGARYEGHLENGLFNGKGTKYDADGARYEGDWKDDQQSGQGVFYWADGSHYEGHLENNMFNGTGTKYFPNGDRYEGE